MSFIPAGSDVPWAPWNDNGIHEDEEGNLRDEDGDLIEVPEYEEPD